MTYRLPLIFALALCGCGGCGTDPGDDPDAGTPPPRDAGDGGRDRDADGGPDAGEPVDGPRVEIGTSARDFVPVSHGDTLLLARGCQGGQHVWISLRIHEMNPRSAVVQLQMVRLRDGEPITCTAPADDPETSPCRVVCATPDGGTGETCAVTETCNGLCQNAYPFQVRTTFDVAEGTDFGQITGLTLQTPDPAGLLDTDVRIRARVTDRDMVSAETYRDVRVEWGTETCGSMRDGAVLGDGGLIPMEMPDAG